MISPKTFDMKFAHIIGVSFISSLGSQLQSYRSCHIVSGWGYWWVPWQLCGLAIC